MTIIYESIYHKTLIITRLKYLFSLLETIEAEIENV